MHLPKSSVVFSCLAVLTLTTSCFAGEAPTTKEVEGKFKKLLRNTKVESVTKSPVEGLYEVTAGPNVFYYSPEGKGYLVFGQILDGDGNNVTAPKIDSARRKFDEIRSKKAAELIKNAPLDKAVKIGNGKNVVIEFTDPDCPYCRKVGHFLESRQDITRYVFLTPLDQIHPNARAKSIYVLNSSDKAKAMREVFSNKFDKEPVPINGDLSAYKEEAERLEAGMRFGRSLGVMGTPYLLINGVEVNGADMNKINVLLSNKKTR